MARRLEIALKPELFDAEGAGIKHRAKDYFELELDYVRTSTVLMFDVNLSDEQFEEVRTNIFTNTVTHQSSYSPLQFAISWSWAIWIGYRPGVRDVPGSTAQEAVEDRFKIKFQPNEAIYTSKIYFISSKNMTHQQADMLARELLANDIIQQWKIFNIGQWNPNEGIGIIIPKVELSHEPTVTKVPVNTDEELQKISDERNLALNPNDIPTIRQYFLRADVLAQRKTVGLDDPTDVELEYIAQARSDHCNHNTFKALYRYHDIKTGEKKIVDNLFKTCIEGPTLELQSRKPWVVSVLWDNAGIAKFDDTYNYVITGETHNSPSNMEAYGGAITGIVGIYRDPMGTGKGSKLISGMYGYCVGPRDYDGELKPKLHPRRLLDGVIAGVRDGGNKSGIPTHYGNVIFDEGYLGKCLVYVTALGIMPSNIGEEPSHEKMTNPGDLIFMCGGRVGKDGIHGVTAASEEYSEHTPAGHVQIGDPYMQKKMHDFLMEVRDEGLIVFITDNGGGGLSSSIGESARFSNGCEVDLAKVPLKYHGLDQWEIWVSESQERMTVAVNPKNRERFLELSRKHDVESTEIGVYTNTGKLHLKYNDQTCAYINMDLLESEFPQWEFDAEWYPPELRGLFEPVLNEPEDYNALLTELLARPNIASKEWIIRQYDHEVQGGSVIKHLVGVDRDTYSDAIVFRPVLDSMRGLAATQTICPFYSKIDTYNMTACVIDEAVRRIVAVGGSLNHLGGVDNFCWPNIQFNPVSNPDGKFKAAQLVRSNLALKEFCEVFEIPLLSGKDSMYIDGNIEGAFGERHKISGLESLQFTITSVVPDVRKCVTMEAKNPGDLVYVLGLTRDELGGSEYYDRFGYTGVKVPSVNAEKWLEMYRALSTAISEGLVSSAHAVTRGGLGVHISMVSFGGGLGLEIDLNKVPVDEDKNNINMTMTRNDKILFSESAGRFIVTIPPANKDRFEDLLGGTNVSCIGKVVSEDRLTIYGIPKNDPNDAGDKNELNQLAKIVDIPIKDLKQAWLSTFGGLV
jgi:phosphoribosylformylglycinamidine synthase